MLCNKIPLRIVLSVVKISYRDFHPPILFVVKLDMPVDSDRAHMASAPDERCVTVLS